MKHLHAHFDGKKHVIWDWNGTLLNDLDHAVVTVNRLLSEEGLPVTTLENYRKQFGFPIVDYYARMGFDISPTNFAALCDRFNDYFYEGLMGCSLVTGARETLTHVKAAGKMQSILSATEHSMLQRCVRGFQIETLFDHIYGIGDKMAGSKIDRGRELMRVSGARAADTVLVGDTDHDLEVAEALGISIVLVEHGHQCPTRHRKI